MCEQTTHRGNACTKPDRYMVHIDTNPFPLGPDGAYGTGRGASLTVCRAHVLAAVDRLNALPHRSYRAAATVRPIPDPTNHQSTTTISQASGLATL